MEYLSRLYTWPVKAFRKIMRGRVMNVEITKQTSSRTKKESILAIAVADHTGRPVGGSAGICILDEPGGGEPSGIGRADGYGRYSEFGNA